MTDPNLIRVWRFYDAPPDLQALSENGGGCKRLQCRCGRGDTVRIPDGQSPTVMDIRFSITRIDLAGFPVGWRLYAWVRRGVVVHLAAVCPDCPRPQRKDGGDDIDAVEVEHAPGDGSC